MLKIHIDGFEIWDEKNESFYNIKEQTLSLEHSLVSISKWESKWHKPFLETKEMSTEETIDYIRCMNLTQNVDPIVFYNLDKKTMIEINDYIHNPMTATWFNNTTEKGDKQTLTSEVVYYWMIALQIPMECQKWHFNRLMTLIRVCNEKNAPQKKMTKKEIMERNRKLNEERRLKYNSNG